MADRALGLAPSPHPQLAHPAAGLELRGRGSRWLHDRRRGRRVPRRLSPDHRRAGPGKHHGRDRPCIRRRLRGDDQPGSDRLSRRGRGHRRVQHAADPGHRRRPAVADPAARSHSLPLSRRRRRRQGARRRGVRVRRPTRRRVGPQRARRHSGGRSTHPVAADVPGERHPLVDGRHRHPGRPVRRGRRHRQGSAASVAPTRRLTGTPNARPQLTDRHRSQPRRTSGRRQRHARHSSPVHSPTPAPTQI